MPNWCMNSLIITGPQEDVLKFKKIASINTDPINDKKYLDFNSFIPIPKEKQKECWYEWELENWGTKWGACNVDYVMYDKNRIGYNFDSAWSPPIMFIKNVSKLFPKLLFEMDYEEGGMCFKGTATFQNGVGGCVDEEWNNEEEDETD